MKKTAFTILFSLLFTSLHSQVTPPVIQWERSLGGTKEDGGSDIIQTSDGGFITAGESSSANIDVINVIGARDAWIVKYDATYQLQWKFKYGGTNDDSAVAVRELPTGGYIVLGYTNSNNGNITVTYGGGDLWVFKLDNNGVLQWQKSLGGSNQELPGSIEITPSGGFIISGSTKSNNRQVSGNHGNSDVWVINLDGSGNLLWQRCYGGSGKEGRGFIKTVPGGGYIFSAETNSSDGDVTLSNPDDIWLVRIDLAGNILWEHTYGGDDIETAANVLCVPGGYVVSGNTFSASAPINNLGGRDGWIFKTDLNGNIAWQNTYGGRYDDLINSISPTADGGFLIAGGSLSYFGDACFSNGEEDFWLVKISPAGKLLWQKLMGGTKEDVAKSAIETTNGSIFITGTELSDNKDVLNHHQSPNPAFVFQDQWLVYLTFTGNNQDSKITITSSLTNICPGKPAHFTAHAVNGGTEPVYTWYLNGVEQSGSADTITIENLQNNDQVTCRLFSRLPCIVEQYVMSNTITMHTYPNGTPSGFLPAEMTKCVNLYEKIKPLTEFASYLWSTGDTTSSITIHNSGEYCLEVTDLTGCKGKEYTTITNRSCMNAVFIPNGFTPNNDGRNDIFKPLIDGKLLKYEFSIYDRWGQLVLRTNNPEIGWDGKRQGIPVGGTVYIWTCTYQLEGEGVKTEKGTVTVIR